MNGNIDMRNERRTGIVITYIGQAVHILSGLLYTPIMLRLLGQSEYGLYQLVYSVVSYLSLLSLGFGSSYMRFYSIEKAKNDETAIAKNNGMFMAVFCTISVICLLCGAVMIKNIKMLFGTGLTDKEYETAKILMFFMIVNMAMTFPNSVFNCIITSQEKFIFQKTLILVHYLLNPFLTLPLLLTGHGSVAMVAVTTLITFGTLIVNAFFCFKKLNSKFIFKDLQFSKLKEMWVFTFFIFLNQIVDQINWSVDKYLLGRMIGTTAVAMYGVGGQINSLYLQLSTAISNVFIPKVNRIVAETENNNELTILFTKVGRVQFILMMLILTGFIFFGQAFIGYWAGKRYNESYIVTLLLICPVTVPLIQNLGIEIQRAKNKHRVRSVVYFFIAIGNVFLSIPLIRKMGVSGAALGTCISIIIGNVFIMNWYYHNKLGIDVFFFWKNIFSIVPSVLISCLFGYLIKLLFQPNTLIKLGCDLLMYIVMYSIIVFLVGMNNDEKSIIISPVKRIVNR